MSTIEDALAAVPHTVPDDGQQVPALPHDDGAEASLLGAILINNELASTAEMLVRPEAFYDERNRIIFRTMLSLSHDGMDLDVVTVVAALERLGQLDQVGGRAHVADLMSSGMKSANIRSYAQIIRETHTLRELARLGEKIQNSATSRSMNGCLNEHRDAWLKQLSEIGTSDIPSAVNLADVEPAPPEFIVDNLVRRHGIVLMWAQPGGYKTTLMLRIANELCTLRRPGAIAHLLEHPELQIRSEIETILFITTEENAGELRYWADAIHKGLGYPKLAGKIVHVYASGTPRITTDDLERIILSQGPFPIVVLDSLTGLRPKTVDGQRIRWDADNDSANELMLHLRHLAAKHRMLFWVVHHSDKLVQNYRGPTDWWASADVMFGLLREDDGRIKVKPQKVRGGKVPAPFLLEPEWSEGPCVKFNYVGEAGDGKALPVNAQKIEVILQEREDATAQELADVLPISVQAVRDNLKKLKAADRAMVATDDDGKPLKRDRGDLWIATAPMLPTQRKESKVGELSSQVSSYGNF